MLPRFTGSSPPDAAGDASDGDDAQEIDEDHARREPFDRQLEYLL